MRFGAEGSRTPWFYPIRMNPVEGMQHPLISRQDHTAGGIQHQVDPPRVLRQLRWLTDRRSADGSQGRGVVAAVLRERRVVERDYDRLLGLVDGAARLDLPTLH